ncbi:anti-CBASS protein Acb1 family protein [Candidatus Borreliella tachyglossi]|uniref:anti-CBASS protein Acb1 family protein n=1 Tax=Candidatus Borreliella tachyglossi TaxID=1964448 RepID=UPI0040432496
MNELQGNFLKERLKLEEIKRYALELYEYSIFFRNYIENTPEDALKNGIQLNFLGDSEGMIDNNSPSQKSLKVKLKDALRSAMISNRFYGYGYILIKTNGIDDDLGRAVNKDMPTGFKFLEPKKIINHNPKFQKDYVEYVRNYHSKEKGELVNENIKIHKSRLIMYENFDSIIDDFVPVYSQGLLTGFELFENIYRQINKRIHNFNFLFYKDEGLVDLMNTLDSIREEATKTLYRRENNSLISNLFKGGGANNHRIYNLERAGDELDRELGRIKGKLHNDGIFYSANENAKLEIIKYDMAFLKDAFDLLKAKIGADTKEPLTRSFNEQAKGLGSDGKGDRTNYYDYLKGVQECVEIACNIKLNEHYNLDMKFNDIEVLNTQERLQGEVSYIDAYNKYLSLINNPNLTPEQIEQINSNLPLLAHIK